MLDNPDFIAPVAASVKKETEKAVDAHSRKEDRRRRIFDAAYDTDARSPS